MNKLLKNMKKVVSIMLVMSMVFTSHAFVTFAEGVDNVETTIEETTVEANNEIVGANSPEAHNREVSPEEDTEETTIETTVAEEEAGSHPQEGSFGETHPYNNDEETTVGANSPEAHSREVSPEEDAEESLETTDYLEEPEEDTKETETIESVGENSVSPDEETTVAEAEAGSQAHPYDSDEETKATEEIKVDTETEANIENIIYGAGSRKFILVGVNSSDEVTAYTVDETTSKETWKAGISSSGIVDYDVNIGTYYRLASGTNLDVDYVKSQYEKYRDEEWRSFTWLENEFDTWKTGSEDKAIGYSYGASAPKYFNVLYINKSSNKTSYEILSGMDAVLLDFKLEELFTLMSDDLKGWHVFTPDDPTDPSSVIENYNPDYSGTAEYAGTKEGLIQAYNDWNSDPTDNKFIGGMFESSTTYTVQYNQNLPAGYTLSDGMTWYTDSTTTDLTGTPIILKGSADMTCEDTSGNTRTLQGWNTYSSGAGSAYSFGARINTDAGFIGDTLTLYAMWSDPVAPTTGFMYWKVDGNDNNKTIHYYASPGEGRAAVVIGTNGVEHTGLGSSDREKIKYAVFEDNIAATNLECCFENFKGLESITNLGKLDTSNVTSMRQMFNFAGVKELDLTNFETSNVTDMYGMFSSCENLETIRVSDKFVVDKVSTSNGKFMFANCDKLEGEKGTKIADLSSPFGVAYAHIDEGSTNPGLFSGASSPPTADWYWYLEGDTIIHYTNTYETGRTPVEYDSNGAVVYNGLSDSLRHNNIETAVFDNKIVAPKAQSFFKEFLSLKTITDITNLDTSSATNFKDMFASCGSLETLDVSSLNTSNATDMESMFQWCNALTSLDVSNFNTSKVTNMLSMFNSCKKLEELDLSSFKTSNVKSMAAMFTNCLELTTIKTTVDFVVDQVTDLTLNNLFEGNTKLVGGQGTTYNASKLKKEYAHIDEGPTNPGYFTGTIPPTPPKTVTKIAIKTNPTKTTYDSGDAFDPTGLVIKVTYSDSSTEEIDYATHSSDFSFNPTTITKSGNVVVTYGGKTTNVAVKVNGGPTPPGPTPPSPGGGGTGGGTSGGGSSDPSKGPMGDLTKELQQQQQQKATDKKQARKVENDELADLLKSYNENHDSPMVNARDDNGNVGFGQWLRIPGSTIWYFLTSDFNQNVTTVNANDAPNPTQTANQNKTEGFLVDGWFNLGWDGVDRWYRFDENGIMLMGWWIEDGKTYFLQTDENDNWYGKAMTGTQVIDGITYNFDENGVLIQ